jgi:hypothetical protein
MFRRSMNRYRGCDLRFSWWTRAMLRRRINRYPAPPIANLAGLHIGCPAPVCIWYRITAYRCVS